MYDITCVELNCGEMAELVEGARLEIVYTGNRIKGSNPFLSAIKAVGFQIGIRQFFSLKQIV